MFFFQSAMLDTTKTETPVSSATEIQSKRWWETLRTVTKTLHVTE